VHRKGIVAQKQDPHYQGTVWFVVSFTVKKELTRTKTSESIQLFYLQVSQLVTSAVTSHCDVLFQKAEIPYDRSQRKISDIPLP
jgi:hypothetical protein